jgi:hypothetical protein
MPLSKIPNNMQEAITSSDLPAGTPVQYLSDGVNAGYASPTSPIINVAWTTSYPVGALYGSDLTNRTYVEASSITITPRTSSSKLACWGTVAWSNMGNSSTGAHGAIITLDDTTQIACGDFPYYANDGAFYGYPPESHVYGTFTLSDSNAHVIRLRPFGYCENSSTTWSPRYRGYQLMVMEVSQ